MKNNVNNKTDKSLKCIDEGGRKDLRDVSNEDKDYKCSEKKVNIFKITKPKQRVFKMMTQAQG